MYKLAIPLLLALAPAAWAQGDCLNQIKFPAQGSWSEYKATYNDSPYTVRYAVVGQENRGGKALQWVELRMVGGTANSIYQMLVPGTIAELNQVQEIVFKSGSQPAMKLSGEMMKMMRGQMDKQSFFGEMCKGVTLVGKEKITVPGGTYETQHFNSTEHASDTWISPEVPFSLVKAAGKTFQLELWKHGDGATSSIKEKPQEMKGMGGPPR
ncbi:MAG: hypothetical protein ACJ8AP_01640 [Gemmatimonadales bacterium]